MEIESGHRDRLQAVLEAADDAFWAVIGDRFPEAKTGDWSPDLAFTRDNHNKEDVLWWLRFNAPELLTEQD